MTNRRLFKYTWHLFTGLFFTGIFIFFYFFYNSHLHFVEQVQLFLITEDFFLSKVSHPGGFAGYLGGFFTQFYFLSLAGPIIITGLLFAIQQLTKGILIKVSPVTMLHPLSFLPALACAMILCDEFYPLSAVIGILLALVSVRVYLNIGSGNIRFISGLFLIMITYWLAGGSYLMLLVMLIAYEVTLSLKPGKDTKKEEYSNKDIKSVFRMKLWYLAAYLILAAGFPLLVQRYLILQPVNQIFISRFYYNIPSEIPNPVLVLFALPAFLMILVYFINLNEKYFKVVDFTQIVILLVISWFGFRSWVNFGAEITMTYDRLVRNEHWNEVIKYAGKKPPANYLSLAMLNLSLAKTGQLGSRMFHYDQHGINGLFLPFSREYVAPMMGNEILYQLSLINASQQYIFESMETIPNMGKSVRAIKRLAETNIINGQYRVSEKYLKLLDKTLFYRRWARKMKDYLYDDEKINNHPDYSEKRKFMVRSDYFFHIENIEAALNRMVKESPENRMAFEYLMAHYLLRKDLGNFMKFVPMMEKMNYREIPVSYQEAIYFMIVINSDDPAIRIPYNYISESTKSQMNTYANIFNSYPDAGSRLRKNFSGTYWYYMHFKEAEINSDE